MSNLPILSSALVTVEKNDSLSTRRNLEQNQAQEGRSFASDSWGREERNSFQEREQERDTEEHRHIGSAGVSMGWKTENIGSNDYKYKHTVENKESNGVR